MTNETVDFPPAFAPFPAPTVHGATADDPYAALAAAKTQEPRKRGPRRVGADPKLAAPYQRCSSDIPGDSGNHMPPQKRKGGRPKKAKTVEPAPVEVQDPTLRLFNAAVGLQHEDLSPLTVAYQALLALPGEARIRVLGILNRVFA